MVHPLFLNQIPIVELSFETMHQILSRFIRNKMFGQSFEVDKVQDELDRLVEVCNLYV